MSKVLFVCSLLTLSFALCSSLRCKPELEVAEGEPMELKCYSDVEIDDCEFEFPGLLTKIRVYKGVQNPNYEFAGNFKEGVCGIRFASAKSELQGLVTSRVLLRSENLDFAEATVNVTVLHPPKNVNMESNGKYYEFKEGQEMRFNCFCSESNPLPNITLSVGEEVLNAVEFQASITANKTAEISDFENKVVCITFHPKLEGQQYVFARPLTIYHEPKLSKPDVAKFEVGENVTIRVEVSAYPMPHTHQWTRPNGEPLDNERYTSWIQPATVDALYLWEAGLTVEEITDEDKELGLILSVENEVGSATRVVLVQVEDSSSVASSTGIRLEDVVVVVVVAFGLIAALVFKIRGYTLNSAGDGLKMMYCRVRNPSNPESTNASASGENSEDQMLRENLSDLVECGSQSYSKIYPSLDIKPDTQSVTGNTYPDIICK